MHLSKKSFAHIEVDVKPKTNSEKSKNRPIIHFSIFKESLQKVRKGVI